MSVNPFDLRHLFSFAASYAPDDDSGPSEGGASSPAGSQPDDVTDSSEGGAAGEEGGEDVLDEPDIKDPKSKRLHEEAKQWRLKFKEAEAKVKTLEESGDVKRLTGDNRTLRLRLAFERALSGTGCQDVEAAWKLAEEGLSAVDVADDGTVDGSKVGTIVNHLLDKHPYFFAWPDEQEQDTNKDAFPLEPSGRRIGGRGQQKGSPDTAALLAKFPALRGR